MKSHITKIRVVVFLTFVQILANQSFCTPFTLSDQGLMMLDTQYHDDATAFIINRRDVPGNGIEFDIFYPGNDGDDDSLYWVSTVIKGQGRLTGTDIKAYDAFALKFTVLSIEGITNTNANGPLIAGAIINPTSGSNYSYNPEVIELSDPIAVSSTSTNADYITTIGFVCNIPSWWWSKSNNPFDPTGSIVTLLVEPAPGAEAIPEPTSLSLLGIGLFYIATIRKHGKYQKFF